MPADGASYVQGQAVSSSYSCDDGAGGKWLVSCNDQRGRPSGSALDTSTLGSHTFTVAPTTRGGMTGTASVTYHVVPSDSGGTRPGGGGATIISGGRSWTIRQTGSVLFTAIRMSRWSRARRSVLG